MRPTFYLLIKESVDLIPFNLSLRGVLNFCIGKMFRSIIAFVVATIVSATLYTEYEPAQKFMWEVSKRNSNCCRNLRELIEDDVV